MYNILVVGAGYLGSLIASDFAARKQRVYAMTRCKEKAISFERNSITPVLADLLKPQTLNKLPSAHFIVLSMAPDESTEENYRKVYLDGLTHFLQALKKNMRPHLIVQISSTSVWKERSGEWVDENVSADSDTIKGKILLASEHLVKQSGYPHVIFRLSGIYGPGRNRIESFKSGIWPTSGSDQFMNLIHVEDAVQSILPIFKKSKEGEVYIGSDLEPVLKSTLVAWLEKKTGIYCKNKVETANIQGKKCNSRKLQELGVKFKYPTFREGYEALLKIKDEDNG